MHSLGIKISGKVVLKRGREHSVARRHPWIFSGGIHSIDGSISDGNWVAVCTHDGRVIAHGHYQNGSISVRILSFGEKSPESNFWGKKISDAVALRLASGLPSDSTNSYRLLHAEGDGVPGLIADYYDGVVVMQAHSAGMHHDRLLIADALKQVMGDRQKAVYYKSRSTLPAKLQAEQPDEYLQGLAAVPHVILEHGHRFYVDWEDGQKTGFFLDQRENRKLLADFSAGKDVLNTFCYSGGFSVYSLKAGARLVHSIDASEKAITLARKNIELNGFDSEEHACTAVDTFEYFRGKEGAYDVIVLDPPAFAKHRDSRHQAVKGYQRLNADAMKIIRKGGVLFTFSCSQVVDRRLFYDTIVSASMQAGRDVKVLHHLSQPADHPVSLAHPEGEYLKGLVLYVA